MIKIIYGETLRSNGGSYQKLEVEITKEIEAKQANINRLFAMARQGIEEQKKINLSGTE